MVGKTKRLQVLKVYRSKGLTGLETCNLRRNGGHGDIAMASIHI